MEIRHVVDWCTKIPPDTPLARLGTANTAIEVIERDLLPVHERDYCACANAPLPPGANIVAFGASRS